MDRKTLTIVLAVALLAGFFLPWGGGSGYDLVSAKGGDWKKYIIVLIPLCGLLLLVGAMNKGNYMLSRGLLTWLPLLAVIFFIILWPMIDGADIGNIFKTIGKGYGAGLWVTIVASIVLAFYNPRA